MKVLARRLLITLGALVLLLGAFHLVENWRGRHAWETWKAAQVAAGRRYDAATYLPAPVPDAENFATAPSVADAIAGKEANPNWALPPVFTLRPSAGDYRQGRKADFKAFADFLKGQSLEDYLRPFDLRLDQFAEAARRPGCRLQKDDAKSDDIPALLGMRSRARVLRTRALARLQAGKPEAALDDVITGLRVVQHFQREPRLITQLLRLAYVGILMQPVWEGLQSHAWNEAQLARLEAELAPIDLISSMKLGWQMESCFIPEEWAKAAETTPDAYLTVHDDPAAQSPGRLKRWAQWALIPKGWVYQNLVSLDRAFQEQIESVLEPANHRVRADIQTREEARFTSQRRTPYNWVLRIVLPPFGPQNIRMARAQTALDQARVACALERYRLAHKGYPATLEVLAPAFMKQVPHDVITGEALRYRPEGSSFTLYSVGWNGLDDGGQLGTVTDDSGPRLDQGDWVWFGGK